MQMSTEEDLRKKLRGLLQGRTQADLAAEIGISQNAVSMYLNGKTFTGKIVRFLGYKKVREKFFVKA